MEESVNVLRKCIEPEASGSSGPAPAPLPDTTPVEDNGVSLVLPTSAVPPPPIPEAQSETEQTELRPLQEEQQENHQEEEHPPPPAGSDELITPTEPPQDSKTG